MQCRDVETEGRMYLSCFRAFVRLFQLSQHLDIPQHTHLDAVTVHVFHGSYYYNVYSFEQNFEKGVYFFFTLNVHYIIKIIQNCKEKRSISVPKILIKLSSLAWMHIAPCMRVIYSLCLELFIYNMLFILTLHKYHSNRTINVEKMPIFFAAQSIRTLRRFWKLTIQNTA